MSSWYAETVDGLTRKIGALGLVIGRAPTCDIVLDHPAISRRHVMVHVAAGGELEVMPGPGAVTALDGVMLQAMTRLDRSARLTLPGELAVALVRRESLEPTAKVWQIEIGGRRSGLRSDTSIGSGIDDELVIAEWPAQALQLVWDKDAPTFVLGARGGLVDGRPAPVQHAGSLTPGLTVTYGRTTVTFVAVEDDDSPPTRRDPDAIVEIGIELLPTGGLLDISTVRRQHRILLSERRFALALTLLDPPAPYRAGELIPDEEVLAAVWPRISSRDRGDLNQLAFRLRADLRAGGLTTSLIERFAKGGATRFVIPPGVRIAKRG